MSTCGELLGYDRPQKVSGFQGMCVLGYGYIQCGNRLHNLVAAHLAFETTAPAEKAEDRGHTPPDDGFIVSSVLTYCRESDLLMWNSVCVVSTVRLATIPPSLVNPDFTWVGTLQYVWMYVILLSSVSTFGTSLLCSYSLTDLW